MGGKSAPPPDYGPLAQASKESAEIMAGLGREQLDFSKLQYEEMKPLAQRIADQQLAAQDEQMGMAREDRARYLSTFAPVEQGLVRRAQEFDTDAYREQLASQAAADAARAFGNTQGMTSRNLSRMGVGPNSGAAMSQMNQNALGLASMRAGAMTGSRLQSEGEGMNRLYNAAALGRGLPGQTLGAYGGANASGSAAQQTAMAPGSQYMQGLGQGASTIGSGLQMQQSGLTSILGNQANLYGQKMQAQGEMYGALLGAGSTLGAAALASDRRLKENIELVGRDERTMLPLYEFEYKGGDGRRFLGVMADDVEKVFPQAVIKMSNGYKAVDYDLLGIEMVEV
jgi:hypothetical protein